MEALNSDNRFSSCFLKLFNLFYHDLIFIPVFKFYKNYSNNPFQLCKFINMHFLLQDIVQTIAIYFLFYYKPHISPF